MMSWTRHGKGTEEQEGRRKDGGGGEGKNVPASHHEDKGHEGHDEERGGCGVAAGRGSRRTARVHGNRCDEEKMRSSMRRRRREEASKWLQTLGPVTHTCRPRWIWKKRKKRVRRRSSARRAVDSRERAREESEKENSAREEDEGRQQVQRRAQWS